MDGPDWQAYSDAWDRAALRADIDPNQLHNEDDRANRASKHMENGNPRRAIELLNQITPYPLMLPDEAIASAQAVRDRFGPDAAMNYSMEEMGELLQAYGKLRREKPGAKEQVIEEIADVLYTCMMAVDYKDLLAVQQSLLAKVERTKEKLADGVN